MTLTQRLDALEKEVAELRRLHEEFVDKCGPQQPGDSENNARWQGISLTANGNGSIRLTSET